MINSAYYDFRQQLLQSLIADIIGPGARDEILDEYPLTRYAAGACFTRAKAANGGPTRRTPTRATKARAVSATVRSLSKVRYPSSMGLTFAVDAAKCPVVRVHLRAARYVCLEEIAGEINLDENGEPLVSDEEERELDPAIAQALRRPPRPTRQTRWKREEIALDPSNCAWTNSVRAMSKLWIARRVCVCSRACDAPMKMELCRSPWF